MDCVHLNFVFGTECASGERAASDDAFTVRDGWRFRAPIVPGTLEDAGTRVALDAAQARIQKYVGPVHSIQNAGTIANIYPAKTEPEYWSGYMGRTMAQIQGGRRAVRALCMALKPDAQLLDSVEGGLVGLLVGDALGVPYEFKRAEELPSELAIDFAAPAGFNRSHPGVPPGTWSDDGAQALCLLESLLSREDFDEDDFGRRLVEWYERGHLAVDGKVFDVGVQTGEALRALRRGVPVADAAPRSESANGNGSLMRVLPLALWHVGSDERLVHDARLSSVVTHAHVRSQLCCALYCLLVRRILEHSEDPWTDAFAALRDIVAKDPFELAELEGHIAPERAPERPGSGYVVDTLRSARQLYERHSYAQVVRAAVALGGDTDTTAAVAGGLAGVRHGIESIPQRWRETLRGRELFAPLLEKLREHRSHPVDY